MPIFEFQARTRVKERHFVGISAAFGIALFRTHTRQMVRLAPNHRILLACDGWDSQRDQGCWDERRFKTELKEVPT